MWPFRKKSEPPVLVPTWLYDEAFMLCCKEHKEGDREMCDQYQGWLTLKRTEAGPIFEALVVRMEARWEGWAGARTFFQGADAFGPYRDMAENTDEAHWYGDTQFWEWAKGRFPQEAKVLTIEYVLQGRPQQMVRPVALTESRFYSRMKRRAQGWYWYVNTHQRKQTA